jgi:hypothetical protein
MSVRAMLYRYRRAASFILHALHPSPIEKRGQAWSRARGDRTLRIEYDLKEDDVVLDVGGYEG